MKKWIAIIIIIILGTSAAHAGGKRALLIGISEYPTHRMPELTWNPIHGANDVELMKEPLRKQGFSITTIKAGNTNYAQAYEDLSGDEADGWDEAIVPYDAMLQYKAGVYDGRNHILDDELEGYVSSIRSKVGRQGYVYLVLDACHMGGASRGDEEEEELFIRGTDQGFTPNGKKYIPKIDRRGNMKVQLRPGMSGICILEACRAYQTNAEIKQNGRYYGPLTYYVNQTLSKISLTSNTTWIETVRTLMGKDRRLIKQNMVSEKSN